MSATALVLWDVDHTLIENSGVAKETYSLAFELLVGRAPALRPATDGRTDGQIIRELLAAEGVEVTPAMEAGLLDALAAAMDRNAAALAERGHALPGTSAAISALGARPGLVQSVLTGNIAHNARVKLAAFGLDRRLDLTIGGYGCDHVDRAALVGIAQRRAEAAHGVAFGRDSTLLIGDTPRDAEAGRDGGARVLGVATGVFSEQELLAAGADLTVPDLRDTEAVVAACQTLLSTPTAD